MVVLRIIGKVVVVREHGWKKNRKACLVAVFIRIHVV